MTTTKRGIRLAGWPPEIEIEGITCKKQIMRKYTLASLENWRIMFLGKKLRKLYLDVLIRFPLNYL
jgi:hypothetical protein